MEKNSEFSPARIVKLVGGGLITILLLVMFFKSWFSVNNHEVVALTYVNGAVEFYTQPGIYGQWLGHAQTFEKRKKYDFKERVQFNDGGYAEIEGSVQYNIPLDTKTLKGMYSYYPTPYQIESGLIETNLKKAIILTGRTMSSKESYAERRGDLLSYMEDQLKHGPYQTKSFTREVTDDLDTTKKKLITVVEITPDPSAPGGLGRSEKGLIEQYNIDTTNFNFTVKYEDKVEKQIEGLQAQAQKINQSIAEAKQAEQRAITAAKNGEAEAATAKWEQEKVNSRIIAEAQGRVIVADNERQAAALNKQKAVLEGEGEAEKKRLIMNADGALQQKLAAVIEINKLWAAAYKDGPQTVPTIQSGGAGNGNGGVNFMDMMGAKAARDLSLDLSVPGRSSAPAKK